MEAYLEMGIVRDQNSGESAIYIKMASTDRHVFNSEEAKLVVIQLFKFIAEVDELNAELIPTTKLQ